MNRLYDVASFVAMSVIQSDMQATMDGYLVDLRDFTDAMEAANGGSFVQTAIKAINDFLMKAKARALELIENIIRRIGEMVGAFNNMIHTKDVKAPDEMVEAYRKMADTVEDLTKNSGEYVQSMISYAAQLDANIALSGVTGGDPASKFIEDVRKENEALKKKVAELSEADVLKGKSVDEYMATHIEANGRTATINPSQEQRKISAWRGKWNRIKMTLKSTGHMYGSALKQSEMTAVGAQKQAFQNTRMLLSQAYNAAMIKITGVLNIISHLQKYVTGFIVISKKYPPMKDIIREPAAGALPAHS